ncbi:MAG: VCBS repeat-containing protein, partial [Trichodesmium sp. ALOHA_ZT_67]|nr:VCBS repeat-containing protein [Trichodesmium sp. ALOHA_ZT_67]
MDEFSPDDHSLFPEEPDETSLNVHYLPGADSNPEVTDPMIQGAWGEVRDELADFILAPEFDDYIKTAFGETVDPELAKEQIKDVLTGENLPEVIMLPAADMEPAVGAYDPLTGSIYLADSLLPDTDGAEDGVLVDVLLEELGHFLDSQLSESDSPGDEGELLAALVRGEELTQFQVMMLRGQDDRVDIWVGGVEVEVEASEKVDFEKVDDFLVGDEPRSLVVGDFNRDGIPDLAVANRADDDVSVLSGKGDGSFGSATNFFVGDRPESLAAGDFNGDGIPDLAVANAGSDNVSVLSGKDDGSFARRTNFPVGDEPRSVAVGDFDRNGIPDLAVANRDSNNVSVLLGNGEGSFGSATNFLVGDEPISVAVEDFNGDGIPDLAAANFFSDNVSVLSGKGDGSFGSATNFPVGETPTSVVARDFNADGIPDLAVANRDSNNVSVLSGKGDGSFGSATNFPLGSGPFSVAVEDFNGDGTPDLAVTNFFSDKVSVSLGKGDGSFGSATNFPVGDRPFSVATEDFNGDGILDMAVANWLDRNVSILINKTPITIIPNITISDTKITEGNIDKTAKFTVTLDNPTNA